MKSPTPWRPNNGLLADLPADVCERLSPDLHPVELPVGKVLYESHAQQHLMYFPRSGIVSLLHVTKSGDSAEIAMVGNEGMVGTAVLVDSRSTPSTAMVQVAGEALVLKADAVDREFKRAGAFQFVILRYTQAVIAQMAQMAICNRHHTVEQQLSRRLLLCVDRLGSNELRMTQEAIAHMLGVRREGVTEAAGRLQEAGLIRYSRGRIMVVDRKGLERRSCECYETIKEEYDRLLTKPIPQ
ncbi:Crp/Fnr family transcriptional regulator [Luteimonas suaedae]|uniref:Crp/Fnr family transcriptional regulator n=1 Tax=Luteimonas suaedae TaxID=2605430 RepID=UPI0011EC20D5|nr:Crp/Fnr family transcriptional regulator [Luteimonas suaedae]